MANTKISALSSAITPLTGSEIVPINQSGVTDSVSVANLTAGRAVSASSLSLTTTPLAVSSGGTGLLSITSNYIPYGNGTSALQSSSNLTFDGTHLQLGTTSNPNNVNLNVYGSSQFGSFNATYQLWYSGAVEIGAFGQGNYVLTGGSTTGMGLWSNTYLSFGAGSSDVEQVRIDSSGNIIPKVAGNGINFTANTPASGMTSQNLTWYEEGTWTPTGNGVTLASASGTYVRIGKSVTVYLDITMPVTANTSQCSFGGLPFTVGKSGGLAIGYTTNTNAVTFNAGTSGTTLNGYLLGGTALSNATYSGARIIGSCTYSV